MDQIVAEAEDAFAESKDKRDRSKDEEILGAAHDAFDQAWEAESDNRKDALDDIRFARLGEQWPEYAVKARGKDRPMLVINRLPAFIRQVVNDARQNRPAIKIRPVDDNADPVTAEVMNGLIRNIEYSSNADVAYDTALENAVDSAWGYVRVSLVYSTDDTFEQDLRIERVANKFRVYGDPRSEAADTSDWNCAFITDMIKLSDFKREYKGAEPTNWDGGDDYASLNERWRDGDDVRVAEYWKRSTKPTEIVLLQSPSGEQIVLDAEQMEKDRAVFDAAGFAVAGTRKTQRQVVKQYILSGAEVLKSTDWAGIYIPISICYGDEVNVDGKRHLRSLIRDAKDPQRMHNFWRTASTELVALSPKAPFIGPKGVFDVDRRWKTANTENHPYMEYDGKLAAQSGPPQRQPFAGVPAGALQEALNSADDMKAVIGIYDASLGARSNETSGVAISARQREGDVSTFHFIDNLGRCIRHTGRILIDLIPKVYTAGRMVRVLGVDGSPQNVRLGPPRPGEQPPAVQMPDGKPGAPKAGVFDLTAGKYDLTVEAGPSYTTKRQEAAAQITEFVRAFPQVFPIIGDLLVKVLDWPGADEIAARLKTMLPPALQGQNPQVQQMQQQMAQMDQQAREAVGQLQAELQKCQEALQKATSSAEQQRIAAAAGDLDKRIDQQKLLIDFYGEVTKRLQANLPVMPGAEGDQGMASIAAQAEQQAQGVQADAAARTEQAAQLVVQAVQAMEQMVQRLEQPRPVQRDENGLIVMH
jgi:hypothetical protein